MSNLFKKYAVTKTDGTQTDPWAQYFVLRLDSDPAARHAVLMYASYINASDPEFANQLRIWVLNCETLAEQIQDANKENKIMDKKYYE